MKAYLFPYEKLHAWQNARKLIKEVYGLTGKLPNQEKFGLVSQINRAAISIASDLGYLKKEEMMSLNEDIQGLANQINSLRNSQLSRI